MTDQTGPPSSVVADHVVISGARRRARGTRALTLVELVLAMAILGAILVGLSASVGSGQSVIANSQLQDIAMAAAEYQLEDWMSVSFTGLLSVYQACGKTSSSDNTTYTAQTFTVTGPSLGTNNTYGTIVIREPTAAEAPWYNKGAGPKWTSGGTPPTTTTNANTGVSCLIVFIRVDLPAGPGHPAVHVAMSGVRYTL